MSNPSNTKPWFVFPKPNPRADRRLFCFPYAGAGASVFHSWHKYLPPEIELCTVQLPGRESRLREAPFTQLTNLVQTLVPLIQPYLNKPFAFYGHSMGALLCFEIARQLHRENNPTPIHLFLSGRSAPQLTTLIEPLHKLPDDEFLHSLNERYNAIPKEILQNAELIQIYLPVLRADITMLETYVYEYEPPLNCPISVFGGSEDPEVTQENLAAWRSQTSGDLTMQIFSGDHFFIRTATSSLLSAIVESLLF